MAPRFTIFDTDGSVIEAVDPDVATLDAAADWAEAKGYDVIDVVAPEAVVVAL